MPFIVPGSEPYFSPGNRTGCILLHGFSAMPEETRPLGQFLADQGYTTLGLRLTGHATHPLDLGRAHWQDWLVDIESGLALLSGITDRVFLIGQSMGGILSLVASSQYPVAGVVAVSTPAGQVPNRLPFGFYFQRLFNLNVRKETYKSSRSFNYRRELDYPAYPVYPARIHMEIFKLQRRLVESLPNVLAPTLILQSHDDPWIQPTSADFIFNHIQSSSKSIVWMDGSGHSILMSENRRIAFEAILKFIQENTSA